MIWILLLTISSAMTRTTNAQTCLRIRCEDPSHDPNMQISCSDEYWYDSTCKFNCLSGYQFSGHPTATCWGDGCALTGEWFYRNEIWSAKCLRIRCDDPSPDPNILKFCSDGHWYDSKCNFNCSSGYHFGGHTTATCWGDGRNLVGEWFNGNEIWSAECLRIRCEDPSHDPYMQISCSDEYWYDSTCNFNCSSGYHLSGNLTANCWGNGTDIMGQWFNGNEIWSAQCLRIRCEDPTHDPNMQKSCSDGHWYGSNCSFNCTYGYELSGHPTANCWGNSSTVMGQWFYGNETWSAKCLPRTRCENPGHDDPNMQLSCSDEFWEESTCHINCSFGHQLCGNSTAFCLNNGSSLVGQWFYGNEIWSAQCLPSPEKVYRACEGQTSILNCGCNHKILITPNSVLYGRRLPGVCPHAANKNLACGTYGGANNAIVEAACNNKDSCSVVPSNSVYGDPCPGTYKYVEFMYQCVST